MYDACLFLCLIGMTTYWKCKIQFMRSNLDTISEWKFVQSMCTINLGVWWLLLWETKSPFFENSKSVSNLCLHITALQLSFAGDNFCKFRILPASLRWRVNNFTINYLPYIKCLILLVMQSLTAKLDIQVLYGKYYLCNKSWYNDTKNSAESSGWVLQFFITFHSHGTRATYSILGEEKVQQSLEGAT